MQLYSCKFEICLDVSLILNLGEVREGNYKKDQLDDAVKLNWFCNYIS